MMDLKIRLFESDKVDDSRLKKRLTFEDSYNEGNVRIYAFEKGASDSMYTIEVDGKELLKVVKTVLSMYETEGEKDAAPQD